MMKPDIRSRIDDVRGVREGDRKGDKKAVRGLRVEGDVLFFDFDLRSRCSPLKRRRWLRPSALTDCEALMIGPTPRFSGTSKSSGSGLVDRMDEGESVRVRQYSSSGVGGMLGDLDVILCARRDPAVGTSRASALSFHWHDRAHSPKFLECGFSVATATCGGLLAGDDWNERGGSTGISPSSGDCEGGGIR